LAGAIYGNHLKQKQMNFLNLNDLKTHSFQQYIDESSGDFIAARDAIEAQNISLIRSKLNTRYDVDEIFTQTGANRDDLIVRVLTILVICDLIGRNKARKVPEDIKAAKSWALDWLQDVRNNLEDPDLPLIGNGNGSSPMWGNNRSDDFYI